MWHDVFKVYLPSSLEYAKINGECGNLYFKPLSSKISVSVANPARKTDITLSILGAGKSHCLFSD